MQAGDPILRVDVTRIHTDRFGVFCLAVPAYVRTMPGSPGGKRTEAASTQSLGSSAAGTVIGHFTGRVICHSPNVLDQRTAARCVRLTLSTLLSAVEFGVPSPREVSNLSG
jgi:hypothetical protein